MSRLRNAALFLGLRQSIVGLLAMVVLLDMGERMAERFLPIYLMALGGGAISVGLLNGLDNLLSALYSFPGGYLSDRLGVKRALMLFNLMAIAGFLVVILIPRWEAVIAGSILFISWTAISQPASMGLIANALPAQKRTMGVSMHSLVRRIPMALGPLVGGVFISHWGETVGVRYAFVAAAGLGLIAMIAQQRLIEDDHRRPADRAGGPERNPLRLLKTMCPELRSLLTSDILIRFCEQIPYAFVVIWAMKTIAHPVGAVQFGVLTTIEMATAILVYVPIATLADRTTKRPFVIITFVFFTLFPLALLFSHSFVPLVFAFILRGFKEFGEPARKALIVDLCPDDQKAGMFGAYYLARDTVVSLAAFGGAFLWQISPATNLLTAFAFGIIGTVWFALRGGAAGQTPALPNP
jgi:MFS family permease